MTKKPSLTREKTKAWTAFSLYIRTRDCVRYSKTHPERNEGLEAPCVTCQRVYPLKSLQAGHFVAGRTNAILFDDRGVNSQCYRCNVGEHGNTTAYWVWMEEHYGREVIDELLALKGTALKMKVWDYQALAEKYKLATKELLDE